MRLSLPLVTLLSIFAASANAFAPPASNCGSRISPLRAGNELSGLLSEYSDSTASATASAAAEKVVNVVTTTVATPPPAPEVVESGMDSLMKAASVAQDAADKAAAAAAAVAAKSAAAVTATKSVAVTKAAVVGGASVAGGLEFKPLIKGVSVVAAPDGTKLPFQVDPSKVNYDNAYDASARAKENLAILKANFGATFGGLTDAAGDANSAASSFKVPSLDVSMPKWEAAALAPAIADMVTSLHLKEYGGWYAAAFMAIIATQQRSAGKEDASAQFETELASARAKASEAASAAGLAAEGAKTAKNLAMKMEKNMKMDGGQALLESSRTKMAETEKDIMKNEMRSLQSQVVSLRNQLSIAEGGKKKAATKKKAKKTEIEQEYPTKVIVDTGADEDGLIIEILKEIDEANKAKKAAELEKKREEEAKFVAAEKLKAAELEKKKEEKAKLAAAEKLKAESEKMTKGVEAAQKKAEAAKKKSATKKAVKKSATKKSATVAKRKTTTKAATKKVVVTKKAVKAKTVVAATADDWASLAESTLKRKTVAQLTEYLTGKGVVAIDDSGKSLKKAELLVAVKSL